MIPVKGWIDFIRGPRGWRPSNRLFSEKFQRTMELLRRKLGRCGEDCYPDDQKQRVPRIQWPAPEPEQVYPTAVWQLEVWIMNNADPNRKSIEGKLLSYIPALHKFARRFHASPSDIDDLVQETLTKALANLDKFEPGTQLKSWLFTIMRNTFCTRFGLSKREHVGLDDDCARKSIVQPVQEWSVRGHELEAAIAQLPEHYREALDLIFIQGISYEAAAADFRCPIGTVKSRVNRARQILIQQLR